MNARTDLSFISTDGLRILNNNIDIEEAFNLFSNFTICFVLQLWFNRDLNIRIGKASYLRSVLINFDYDKNTKKVSLAKGSKKSEISLLNSLNGKFIVIWLTGNNRSNIIKAAVSNISAKLTINASFSLLETKILVGTEDGIIKKIMYSPNFYDFDSEQYHRIMLQEKLNGSYIL